MRGLLTATIAIALAFTGIGDAEAKKKKKGLGGALRSVGSAATGGMIGGAAITIIKGGKVESAPLVPPVVKEVLPPPLKKEAEDIEEAKNKRFDDINKNASQAVKDLDREATKAKEDFVNTAKKAEEDSRRAYIKGWQDTADAVKAVGKFAERQVAGKGEILDAAQRRAREGKFVDAFWHTTTDQVRQTSRNAGKAVQESAVLNAAAATAATAYGGPGGAAAYAAWYTYNQTKDLGLALKAGIVSGALSVGLPAGTGVGGQVAAGAAKGAAVAVIEGGDVESMKKAMINGAIAGGVQGVGQLPQGTTAEVARKAIVAGAVGGIAVAAAGGDEKAVRDAFLKEGGRVIVQYAQRQAQASGSALVKEAGSICISAVGTTCETAASKVKDAAATYKEVVTTYKEATKSARGTVDQGMAIKDGQWALSWGENVKQPSAVLPSIVVTIDQSAAL